MNRFNLVATLALILTAASTKAQESTTVNILNDNNSLLSNGAGVALSAGAAGNSNGALIQLGYYSNSSVGNNFNGAWVALTSFGASSKTTVGDSLSGSNLANGRISFNIFYSLGTSVANVYVPGSDAGSYTTSSQNPITTTLPSPNQVLSIRFFDTNAGSGSYNAVSSDSWLWKTPSGDGPSITLNLATNTLVFQDSANPFKTTIGVVPEPTSGALAVIGISVFLAFRRRHCLQE